MWLANKGKNDLPQMVFMGYKLNNLNPQAHTPLCVIHYWCLTCSTIFPVCREDECCLLIYNYFLVRVLLVHKLLFTTSSVPIHKPAECITSTNLASSVLNFSLGGTV